ncbi:histidine--tRNA ligase [Fodinisporobacter ferrooxydans]|uniref:Histidine--tRNA ligase n=1 Tax=Fodinisporobacter ferrooxydans TaxID=2901836 RepID=A0ABY4CE61_9BACL|nr:histidine--tRNA ligase [Alicyclobacillaceae bacterium MYW30-H2]
MAMNRPRGTADILPGEVEKWQFVERTVRDVFGRFHYQEVRTPIFEHTELFQRGVGETTDIVEKEMYTFEDRGNRSLTLRPEGTASVVRAYVENKLYGGPQPSKLFYIGPMFRYERPQAGRQRQFHQYGVEVIGSDDPAVDAEVIMMAVAFLQEIGLKQLQVEINSVGCSVCRAAHREHMMEHLAGVREQLCKDCQGRFERNPLRILDCKNESCKALTKDAPTVLDHLCESCSTHFAKVRTFLDACGISYVVNPRMVRGLDYYTKTAFEIIETGIGAQSTIIGGGRYNKLVSEVGGPDTPGIGFAGGMERAILAMQAQSVSLTFADQVDLYVIGLGPKAETQAVQLLQSLRTEGFRADKDYAGRGMKAQLKTADRLQAKFTVVIGEEELQKGAAVVKTMASGEQQHVPFADIGSYCKKHLGGEIK